MRTRNNNKRERQEAAVREDPVQLCSGRHGMSSYHKAAKNRKRGRERLLEEIKSSELRDKKRLQLLLMVAHEREVNLA